jgi:hypothetical protein
MTNQQITQIGVQGIAGITTSSRRSDYIFFRPVSDTAFLKQILPIFRDQTIDIDTRRTRILSLASRLRTQASRYLLWPPNWWKVYEIHTARVYYEILCNTARLHDIILPEITWW